MIRLEGDSPKEMTGAEPLVLDLWKAEAERGVIWVPHTVTNVWAAALRMALYRLRDRQSIEVLIDCTGGYENSFEPCHELAWRRRQRRAVKTEDLITGREVFARQTTSTVLQHARSIGLSGSGVRGAWGHQSGRRTGCRVPTNR